MKADSELSHNPGINVDCIIVGTNLEKCPIKEKQSHSNKIINTFISF
jgi:hypothetical protein